MNLADLKESFVRTLREHGITMKEALEAVRREYIVQELETAKSNQYQAAWKLKMHRNTLGRALSKYRIYPDAFKRVRCCPNGYTDTPHECPKPQPRTRRVS